MPRTIARRWICMTNRAYFRRRTLKKLLFVAAYTGLMFRVIRNIRKGCIFRPYLIPIVRGEFMTIGTGHFMRLNIVREFGILSPCLRRNVKKACLPARASGPQGNTRSKRRKSCDHRKPQDTGGFSRFFRSFKDVIHRLLYSPNLDYRRRFGGLM